MELAGIVWKRVILAGFLSEMTVIVVLSAVIICYRFLIRPGQADVTYQAFGQNAGYYLAAPVASPATLTFAFWASRGLQSHSVANAVVVGLVATVLALGFLPGARPSDRPMYMVSFVARILAGYLAGVIAGHAG
jgi:hypothetical protein